MTSLLVLSLASLPKETVTLRINPAPGLVRSVRQETVFQVQGVKFTYRSLVEEVHQAAEGGSFTATFALKEGTLISPGTRTSVTDQPRALRTSPLGIPVRTEGETPGDLRLRRLTSIPLAQGSVRVGDSWSFLMPQEGEGIPELKGSVKLLALEKVMGLTAAKISAATQEQMPGGASAATTGWIDASNGLPIKLRTELKKAPFAGGISDGSWSMALQLPSPPKPGN